MRFPLSAVGLVFFALVTNCGYDPHPKNGKFPCSAGCPSGYICRPDLFCYQNTATFPDSGTYVGKGDTTIPDVTISDAMLDTGRRMDSFGDQIGQSTASRFDTDGVTSMDTNTITPDSGIDISTVYTTTPDVMLDVGLRMDALVDQGGQSTALHFDANTVNSIDAPLIVRADAGSANSPDTMVVVDASGISNEVLCGPATAAIFKDSFDNFELVTGEVWHSYSAGGATFSLDKVDFASAPASALATLPAVSDMTMTDATLSCSPMRELNTHHPTVYLAFDIKISARCVARSQFGFSIARVSPSLEYSFNVYVEPSAPNTLYVVEFKGMGNMYPNVGHQIVKLDEWQHVQLQIRFSGVPLGFLQVGEGPAKYFTPHPSGSAIFGDQRMSFSIGPYLHGPSDGCTINYDNVVFDAPPPCP